MATGQNNNNRNPNQNPNRPNNQNNRRPSNNRRKVKVPGAVIAIYIMMAVLVLAICALIFVVTLKATGWDGSNQGDSSGAVLENSSDSSGLFLPGNPAGSSDNSESSDHSDTSPNNDSSDSSDSSSSDIEWTLNSPDSPDSSVDSSDSSAVSSGGSWTVLPTNYDEEIFADDLFIGDSIFTGLYLYGYMDVKNVAAAVGYTPYKAMYSAFGQNYSGSAVDYAAEMKPKRIFIMLGSNAVGAGTDYDMIVSHYKSLIEMLKLNCPDSDICVISIPPVTSDSSSAANAKISNKDIDSVNVKLKNMASGAKVKYFDLNTMLSDDNGYFMKEYAEMDGLHFKGNTYKVLLSALQREVIEE